MLWIANHFSQYNYFTSNSQHLVSGDACESTLSASGNRPLGRLSRGLPWALELFFEEGVQWRAERSSRSRKYRWYCRPLLRTFTRLLPSFMHSRQSSAGGNKYLQSVGTKVTSQRCFPKASYKNRYYTQ